MELKSFISENIEGIQFDFTSIFENPYMLGNNKHSMNHYQYKITYDDCSLCGFFSTGLGRNKNPTLTDVLECLVNDAQSVQHCDFDEWCDNLGFEKTVEHKRTYKLIKRETKKLRELLGSEKFAALLECEY